MAAIPSIGNGYEVAPANALDSGAKYRLKLNHYYESDRVRLSVWSRRSVRGLCEWLGHDADVHHLRRQDGRAAGGAGRAIPTENADVKIEVTGFMVDGKEKQVVYTFGFTEKNHATPRSVKVEDVTGPTAEVLVDAAAPQLDPQGYWKGDAKPLNKGDPGLAWLDASGDTIKVFRFTIVTADGRELVMYQASVWSGGSKPVVRQVLS